MALRTPKPVRRQPKEVYCMRLDPRVMDQAAAMLDLMEFHQAFEARQPSISGILELAINRGLPVLRSELSAYAPLSSAA